MWAIDTATGEGRRLGKPEWRGVVGISGLAGAGYAVEKGTLYTIDLKTGVYAALGRPGDWRRATGLCASGAFLFAVEGSRLYRIGPTGAYKALGRPGDWPGEVRMAGLEGLLINWYRDGLYAVDLDTGEWALLGDTSEWGNTQALAGFDRTVYVAVRSELWTVDAHTGVAAQLGASAWEGDIFLAACEDGLFAINDEDLFRIDIVSGKSERLSSNREWSGANFLAAI